MAKKSFGAGATKPGILNTDGGEKLKEMQAKIQYNFNYIPKEKIVSNPKNEMHTGWNRGFKRKYSYKWITS